jgi:hypothetical protein
MSRTTNETPLSGRLPRVEDATDTKALVGERLACLDDSGVDESGPEIMSSSPFLTALLRALGAPNV